MRPALGQSWWWVAIFVVVASFEPTASESGPKLTRVSLGKVNTRGGPMDPRFEQLFAFNDDSRLAHENSSHIDPLRVETLDLIGINYVIDLNVGRPAQTFRIYLDMGSDVMWIPSISCETRICLDSFRYDSSKSTTHGHSDARAHQIKYADGLEVWGHFGDDVVEFSGISLSGQKFLEAENVSRPNIEPHLKDGIMGLRFESQVSNYTSPMMNMIRRQLISEPIISFSFKPKSESRYAGEMILGGLAKDKFMGNITWAPNLHRSGWQIRLDSVRLEFTPVNKTGAKTEIKIEVCKDGCSSKVDINTAMIYGSYEDVAQINRRLGTAPIGNGSWKLMSGNLDGMPNMVFTISGQDFILTPDEYVIRTKPNLSGLRADDSGGWILGDLFIKRHYTVFDYVTNRIGFAQSFERPKPN